MNLYFTVEFRRCLDLFSSSIGLRTCSSLICNASIHFQKKIRKIRLRCSRLPIYGLILGVRTCNTHQRHKTKNIIDANPKQQLQNKEKLHRFLHRGKPKIRKTWLFHVVVLLRTAEKCTKIYNTRVHSHFSAH